MESENSKEVKTVKALTFDSKIDGWEDSTGFVMRDVVMPEIDEAKNPEDALSVIIKMRYAGVCGTDKGLWCRCTFKDLVHNSLEKENKNQRIMGHEFVGEIVEVGSMVERLYNDLDPQNAAKVEVGSLVSGDSHVTCGRCFQCRVGEENVCMNESILGISIDGIFAEYVKIPAKNLWPVDLTRIRPEIASILDPFGNAVHVATKVDFRGKRVAIFGCGAIGLFEVLLAKDFGAAKIIAIDTNEDNLKMAKELGAHETVLIKPKEKANDWEGDPEVIEEIMRLTYGKGVDVSLEMAGPFSSVNNAIDATRRGGDVIFFGLKDGDLSIPKFNRVIVRGLTIHNVIGREIFNTWQISQRVLSNKENGIQDAIWDVILKGGKETILPFSKFSKETFEEAVSKYPKIVFDMQS